MAPAPRRSPGVLTAALGDNAVAYDLVTETVHHLNASAGALLAACDADRDLDEILAELSRQTGTAIDALNEDVTAALETFRELGLVDRTDPCDPPPVPVWSTTHVPHGSTLGLTHRVVDHRIAFRCTDPDILATLDASLGDGIHDEPNLVLDVTERPTGDITLSDEITLSGEGDRSFPDAASLAAHLPSILTQHAVRSTACVVLHAGGVRSPDGDVVLLPAPSGSGKSTLTAALLAAGWDYISDEAVGVRSSSLIAVGYPKPLSLSPTSRAAVGLPTGASEHVLAATLRAEVELLGGDVAAVNRVVLPTHAEGAKAQLVDLEPWDALSALLANTLNLVHVGQDGLDTLCDLAERVPVQTLAHGGVHQATEMLEKDPK